MVHRRSEPEPIMTKTLKPDLCVIGGGESGQAVAAAAAAHRMPVVLIEKSQMGGRLLHSRVPTSALAAAALRATDIRGSEAFGIRAVEPEIDYRAVSRHVRDVMRSVAPNHSAERFTALGVRVLKAEARFVDRRTVAAGEMDVCARRFVIATGSLPHVPPIDGLDAVPHLTPDTVHGLPRLPARLIVIGAGPTGLVLAQSFRRLGSDVTVLDAATPLGREDPELAALVLRRMRAEGVDIREATRVVHVERRGRTGIRLVIEEENGGSDMLDGTHLLVATGRRPVLDGLGLEEAGVAFSETGIRVRPGMVTRNRRIHAIGSVVDPAFAGVPVDRQAAAVMRKVLSARRPDDDPPCPCLVLTDPPLASVGLGEAEARRSHRRIRVLRWPYAENLRAQAEHRTEGVIKVIADDKERILGVSICGAEAGELIAAWSLAIANGLGLREMAELAAVPPSFGEIGKRAAIPYFAGDSRGTFLQRIIRTLRTFG